MFNILREKTYTSAQSAKISYLHVGNLPRDDLALGSDQLRQQIGRLPYFLPRYFRRPCSDPLHLHVDVNYTPLNFRDCVLHGCDTITDTKSGRRPIKHLANYSKPLLW